MNLMSNTKHGAIKWRWKATGDPFQEHHFCDSYKEAYERCLDYIKHHENYINKKGE